MSGATVIVGVTGASGSAYALRLCEALLAAGRGVTLLVTDAGALVLREEAGLDLSGGPAQARQRLEERFGPLAANLQQRGIDDLMAPVASGSSAAEAMVVIPCSMGTLSRIAHANSGNLLERCADVMLKERRPLVVVPRETPLGLIHIENMLALARAGATLLPAMPAFYHRPQSVEDMVDFVAGKVLDLLGVPHELYKRWGA